MIAAAVTELGTAEGSYLFTEAQARLDGTRWLPGFDYRERPDLSRMLQAACYVVIGYLSGMRDSEKRAELRLMQHSATKNMSEHAGRTGFRRALSGLINESTCRTCAQVV